jgi:predicted solute-binding protein
MDVDVIRKHIDLYVNHYSLELDEKGKRAVFKLFDSCGIDSSNVFVI